VILACNTASAKALRTIQQNDLAKFTEGKRVLGVIRPTTEVIGNYSKSRSIGIFATAGTVASGSYPVEILRFFPDLKVTQEACPVWVPLIENNELDNEGTEYFVRRHVDALLKRDPGIDTILLGCTHYPLLEPLLKKILTAHITLVSQGAIVAASLRDYLARHNEMDRMCSKQGSRLFYTTDDPAGFDRHATLFFGSPVSSQKLHL
jgi:glutamate racemase